MKIICNPVSYGGKARKAWPTVVKALKDAGLDFEVEWTKEPGDAIRITKASVKDHKVICAYGGDGTINEVLTGIGQTGFKNTLGMLPAGRGNDNAFSVRQTNHLADLVDMLVHQETRTIDCLEINGGERYCLGVAGAGIDAVVAEMVLGKSSRLSYNLYLVKGFFTYRPKPMQIDIDDGRITRNVKALSILLCNGQRVGNKKMVAPNAVIDDGLIDIAIIGNTRILETLITSLKLTDGSYIEHPKVEVFRGKKVVIHTTSKKSIPAHAMGEMLGPLPHTFVCLHKVLKILRMSDTILKREGWDKANVFSENLER